MSTEREPVILGEEDFQVLNRLTENVSANGEKQEMSLSYELKRARVVKNGEVPKGTVRLNSKVTVRETESKRVMTFTLVLPPHADVRQQKVSVLTPMGAALIGLSKGNRITWKMPAGIRTLEILEVEN